MVNCMCGNVAVVKTSWTVNNPGRRFFACPVQGSACPFLGWLDPPMCQRACMIIPGLLRARNEMEQVVCRLDGEVRNLKFYLLCSWVFFIITSFLISK